MDMFSTVLHSLSKHLAEKKFADDSDLMTMQII